MLELEAIRPRLLAALAEDIGPGDITSELLVPADALGLARVRAKASGVVAGIAVALEVLRLACDGELEVQSSLEDGVEVVTGDVVFEAAGNGRALLGGERTALNFLTRLSGIATLTARFVEAVAGTGALILDTRKTTPGWRDLERHAVRVGGGHNHRYALYDAVLVKENHLAFVGDLKAALSARPAGMEAVVEAESLAEFGEAIEAGADVVMLDDFTPSDVAAACAGRGDDKRPLIEVSGGIDLRSARAYAEAGAERISVGALTHSAPALDMSLRVSPMAAGPA